MQQVITLPNILSFLRIPLALFLFVENPILRFTCIVLACVSDVLDGFLARKAQKVSTLGTFLDPITDKFFVFTALYIFSIEQRISSLEVLCFLCRDLSLIFFSTFLFFMKGWGKYRISAFFCGKLTTS